MATSLVGGLPVWSDTTATEVDSLAGAGSLHLVNGIAVPIDPATSLFMRDDFASREKTNINTAELGWTFVGGSASYPNPEANHPGILRRDCSATPGTLAYMALRGTPTTGILLPAENFDMTWIVRMNVNDANTVFRFGLTSDPNSLTAQHGIYVEKKAADTQWFGVCRASNTESRSTALATCDTSWHRFRIWRSAAGTISFSIDGAGTQTVTTNIPTAGLMPGNHIYNNAASESKTFDIDYFSLLITGMTR